MNILLTNAGRKSYFIDYFNELKIRDIKLNIFVSDCEKSTASFHSNKNKKQYRNMIDEAETNE